MWLTIYFLHIRSNNLKNKNVDDVLLKERERERETKKYMKVELLLFFNTTGGQTRVEGCVREIEDCIEIQLILEFIEYGEGYWPSAFAH